MFYAILAHAHRACLEDLVENLRASDPGAAIGIFNGGRDRSLTEGLDIEVCPHSEPVFHGKLEMFHIGVMRWLWEERRPFEFLVLLDADMLAVKPGFSEYLRTTMRDSAYMAARFRDVSAERSYDIGRRFGWKWKNWQPLLGASRAHGCFNPGQVWRREFVESVMGLPQLPAIIDRVRRSRLGALEEVVFPTLAVALGANPIANPGGHAILERVHTPEELVAHAQDPDVHLIHRVTMRADAGDREVVRALVAGRRVDPSSVDRSYLDAGGWTLKAALSDRAQDLIWDAEVRLLPELRRTPPTRS